MKLRPYETIAAVFIDPVDYVRVTWEETPEGYVVERREVPARVDWAAEQLVHMKLAELPEALKSRFYSWANFLDMMFRMGLSPAKIVENFTKGYNPSQRNDLLDALNKGLFAAEIPWIMGRAIVSKEELDSTLAEFGVMECPY